ncbi:longevity assurance proteins LAG1/LAC1 [Hymenopellis radicata]|nr:longevity assurance proteins LAG1/LAC1 [Hymenopellis radicata]
MGKSLEPIISPYLGHSPVDGSSRNLFQVFFLLSHYVPTSSPDDPRYQKGYYDLAFIAYYIVFWSMVRQLITVNLCQPAARYFRIRKVKLERFGEQGYATIYFFVMGCWGYRIMGQLPTFWYRTEYFWLDYPHWDMKPELKRYYLMQMAYWCQQFLVLVLGLEKPRKDYAVLVVHHFVTIWLVGWSYMTNMTVLGSAVYMSMDIPDSSLALSMLLNYMQKERSKTIAFAVLLVLWTYFRHYLSLVILWSVWFEFELIPEAARVWHPPSGYWMPPWIRYQMFIPLALLQGLNLFWYFLIMRILVRTLLYSKLDDERSDDEDEGDDSKED